METVLKIYQTGFPLFSARNCVQELFLHPAEGVRRTVNGELVAPSRSHLLKYCSIVKGKDRLLPAIGQFWQGSIVEVACIQILVQRRHEPTERTDESADKESLVLDRLPVKGSVRVFDDHNRGLPFRQEERHIFIDSAQGRPWFVGYRPSLTMMVTYLHLETHENPQTTHWALHLEEL